MDEDGSNGFITIIIVHLILLNKVNNEPAVILKVHYVCFGDDILIRRCCYLVISTCGHRGRC